MAAADPYDVIVVGARCAGSPTAMLLARQGYKVLVVDRATFPSDTLSTHVLHPPGVAALQRWGLLDQLVATGCPPLDTYTFDFGFFTISGAPGTDDAPVAYCPRRIVLDKLLVDAAAAAGAEVREAFTLDEVVDRRRARGRYPRPQQERQPHRGATRGSSSAPTGASRASPRRSAPSSTTRSRRSCAGTTAIGAACPRRVGSTSTRDPSAASPPHRPTTG